MADEPKKEDLLVRVADGKTCESVEFRLREPKVDLMQIDLRRYAGRDKATAKDEIRKVIDLLDEAGRRLRRLAEASTIGRTWDE